jgi:hypothetical protein
MILLDMNIYESHPNEKILSLRVAPWCGRDRKARVNPPDLGRRGQLRHHSCAPLLLCQYSRNADMEKKQQWRVEHTMQTAFEMPVGEAVDRKRVNTSL